MYLLVLSDNLLTLFVGWEIMGLCSYLLIGFWYGKPSARAAMIKAFLTTRVGDVFMLLGIAYLYSASRDAELPRDFLQSGDAGEAGRNAFVYCWAFCSQSDRYPAVYWHDRQISAVAAACVAPGCDGRPDPRLGHDPCGNDGLCRCVYGDPSLPTYGCRDGARSWI